MSDLLAPVVEKDKITLVLPMELTVTMEPENSSLYTLAPRPPGFRLNALLNLSGRFQLNARYYAIRDEFLAYPERTIESLLLSVTAQLSQDVVGRQLMDEYTSAVLQGKMK